MAGMSARETAYRILRNKIIHLELKPGAVLNVNDLAEQMGMSRTPLREAIIMLDIAKLVVVRPQSGTFVSPINLEIAEMEQFNRFALEKEMLHRACYLMTQSDRKRYEENLEIYKFYRDSHMADREEKLMEIDNEFHRIAFVVDKKENNYIQMLATLQHIERLRILGLISVGDDQVYKDHLSIVEALFSGDSRLVERRLENHMNRYQEHLQKNKKLFPQYFATE